MRRILVVDDSMTIRALYKQMLSHMPHTSVTFATDGQQAIEIFDSVDPHIVFLDINMPRMNGLEVLKELRGRGVATPIILATTEGQDDDLRRGREAGATDYLRKPFPLTALRPLVERLAPIVDSVAVPVSPAVSGDVAELRR
jgi:CheY-like chemotaxis protein